MKKKIVLICCALFATIIMAGCCLQHDWENATCQQPRTCSKCGATEGGKEDHVWLEATCEAPKTCEVCGKTKGDALGHVWMEATCKDPQICETCGATKGEAKGHSWSDSTCVEARFCYICGESDGVTGEHVWREATCTEPRMCMTCDLTEGEPNKHSWSGSEYIYCSVCYEDMPDNSFNRGEVLFKGITYTLTSDYNMSSSSDEFNGVYSNGKAVFTMAPYWNYDITEAEALEITRTKCADAYTMGDEYYASFGDSDYEFYVIEITYQDMYYGYCTMFYRENTFVYMEVISADADYVEEYYPEVMATFDTLQFFRQIIKTF